MDENNRADKELLIRGLKQMVVCLVLMFLGPFLIHTSLYNEDKPYHILLLVVSIILCIVAIIMLFIGLNTILNSIFKRK